MAFLSLNQFQRVLSQGNGKYCPLRFVKDTHGYVKKVGLNI